MSRSCSATPRWYPSWVYSVREDFTRRNMALYDRQMEQVSARCREINPDYFALHPAEQYKIWKQAHVDLGIS